MGRFPLISSPPGSCSCEDVMVQRFEAWTILKATNKKLRHSTIPVVAVARNSLRQNHTLRTDVLIVGGV